MKFDPRTKILCLLVFIASVFVASSYTELAVCLAVLIISMIVLKTSVYGVLKILGKTLFLILISSVISALVNSINAGIMLGIRLILTVSSSCVLNQSTSIKQISDALERILRSRDLAMIISISLNFVPVLIDEAKRIKESQMARGASFSGNNLISKAKALIPLAVPMFQNAFRRATALGDAMQARGYDIDCKKTKMNVLKYSFRDFVLYILTIAFLALIIYLRRSCNVI